MRQFAEALEVGAAREPDDWSREAQKIQSLRSELDGHVRELHRVFPGGLSAYHCLAWLLNHAEDPDFAWTLPEALTQPADTLDRMRGAIRDLAAVFARTPPEAHQALDWLGAAAPPTGARSGSGPPSPTRVACAERLLRSARRRSPSPKPSHCQCLTPLQSSAPSPTSPGRRGTREHCRPPCSIRPSRTRVLGSPSNSPRCPSFWKRP